MNRYVKYAIEKRNWVGVLFGNVFDETCYLKKVSEIISLNLNFLMKDMKRTCDLKKHTIEDEKARYKHCDYLELLIKNKGCSRS